MRIFTLKIFPTDQLSLQPVYIYAYVYVYSDLYIPMYLFLTSPDFSYR